MLNKKNVRNRTIKNLSLDFIFVVTVNVVALLNEVVVEGDAEVLD